MDVTGAYVSFTEVEAGAHDGYNRWHLFDHLPEQYRLGGIAWGCRWVLPPRAGAGATARPPLDRVHYVTLYLLTEPFDETVREFRTLGRELADAGRFHLRRTSHLSGPLRVRDRWTAPGNPLDARAVPFAPARGVRVVLDGRVDGATLAAEPAAVGAWAFDGVEQLEGQHLVVAWHAAPTGAVDVSAPDPSAAFDAALSAIDPFGPFDWFDG